MGRNKFETCAFFSIIQNGAPKQKEDTIERMCEPYCKEECPVRLDSKLDTELFLLDTSTDLEFTDDNVVPYQEVVVFHGKAQT